MKQSHPFYPSFLMFVLATSIASMLYAAPLDEAHRAWREGRLAEAETSYRNAMSVPNTALDAYLNCAALYCSSGTYANAIACYEHLVGPSQKVPPDIAVSFGETLLYTRDYDRAAAVFEYALAQYKREQTAPSFFAYFGLGRVYLGHDMLAEAEQALKEAQRIDPTNAGTYYYLGKLYEKKNLMDAAIEQYEAALKNDGFFVEARIPLVQLYFAQKKYEQAHTHAKKIRSADEQNPWINERLNELKPYVPPPAPPVFTAPEKFSPFIPFEYIPRYSSATPSIRVGINTNGLGKPVLFTEVLVASTGTFYCVANATSVFTGIGGIAYMFTISTNGYSVMSDSNSVECARIPTSWFTLVPEQPDKNTFIIRDIEYVDGLPVAAKEDRQYRGTFEIHVEQKGFRLVNIVNVDEYVYSVLPSEMLSWYPPEALKAQAVVARSYVLYKQRFPYQHKFDGYDVCDGQHCQVYKGISEESPSTNAAVNATRGEVRTYNGKLVNALYHANCGGHTISAGEIKGWSNEPYLMGVPDTPLSTTYPTAPCDLELWIKTKPDAFCADPLLKAAPAFRWIRIIPAEFLTGKVNRGKNIGRITCINPIQRSISGNVNAVLFTGTIGSLCVERESDIRRLLGIGPVRSTLVWIETQQGPDGYPSEFIIYGGGWGHSVGLCQAGAGGMANKGYSYRDILSHYYTGTTESIKN